MNMIRERIAIRDLYPSMAEAYNTINEDDKGSGLFNALENIEKATQLLSMIAGPERQLIFVGRIATENPGKPTVYDSHVGKPVVALVFMSRYNKDAILASDNKERMAFEIWVDNGRNTKTTVGSPMLEFWEYFEWRNLGE